MTLGRLNELIDLAHAPALRFPPFEPKWPQGRLPRHESICRRLREGDVLLHHPFESFEPVVQFLREAVNDAEVLAIKMTIYRTGTQSVLMDLLLEAAHRGKEVMVVVELKARYDEEANINWAERLEAVGVQVARVLVPAGAAILQCRRTSWHAGTACRHAQLALSSALWLRLPLPFPGFASPDPPPAFFELVVLSTRWCSTSAYLSFLGRPVFKAGTARKAARNAPSSIAANTFSPARNSSLFLIACCSFSARSLICAIRA